MNDQHPHAGHVGHDGESTGSFDTDPLFGVLPDGQDSSYQTGYATGYSGYDTAYATGAPDHSGQYDATQWATGAQQTAPYDAYTPQAQPQQPYDASAAWTSGPGIPAQAGAPDVSGQWDSTAWQQTGGQQTGGQQTGQWAATDTGAFPTTTFSTASYETGSYDLRTHDTGAHDTGAYGTASYETGAYDTGTYDTGSYATTTAYGTGTYDSGTYDATAWNSGATPGSAPYEPEQTSYSLYEQRTASTGTAGVPSEALPEAPATAEFAVLESEAPESATSGSGTDGYRAEEYEAAEYGPDEYRADGPGPGIDKLGTVTMERAVDSPRPVARSASRSRARRRSPAKRSALLTVAVPSACVMSVAGIAAASVGGLGETEKRQDDTISMAVADPSTVKPVAANNKLDTQLARLSADADDFRDRASRTQERIDLKERQAAEKKKRAEEAARREALRPKFVLPVKQHGLSAYYGQAGVNWMSVHTGIDFPVGYGTPVMAATDGTVRTQLNSAYGNMVIVTMADGTETWYCHLSSTRIRSGPVKAGDVIGYAGDSGNSTGAHLHFEVRPGGGSAIDPLAWLRSHGLNPT
ncbi:M23 family metallopeptidase [Streptomyces sp. NBC_00654]|uniref:M23 family metallopeptidase n=1 Tax=Streptomyces sp. NBC_00654 TaxID=2975799 RepID=UPI0022542569|nr:M23 family metallopeptidase [Streptomyces sp. NBC_00654]MCX4964336.1 M23 family metallopeptidase [Streptomyces sp. NBC_00654]